MVTEKKLIYLHSLERKTGKKLSKNNITVQEANLRIKRLESLLNESLHSQDDDSDGTAADDYLDYLERQW